MITKKATKKNVRKPATAKTELVAGRFRPTSDKAKLFWVIEDKKEHSYVELQKAIKSDTKRTAGRLRALISAGIKIKKTDTGVILVSVGKAA